MVNQFLIMYSLITAGIELGGRHHVFVLTMGGSFGPSLTAIIKFKLLKKVQSLGKGPMDGMPLEKLYSWV